MPTDATAMPGRPSPRHQMVVLGAALAAMVGQFVILSASIVNPPLAEDLGVGLSQVTIYNSLMALSGVLSMMVLGPWLYRRIGVQGTMIWGGLFMAVTVAAVAFVQGVIPLWVLGFATGLSFGPSTTMAASMLINTWFEAKRGTFMGAVFAAAGVGGIAAGLVLPATTQALGWRGSFLVLGGVTFLLVAVPGVLLIRSTPQAAGLQPYGARPSHHGGHDAPVVLGGVRGAVAFRTPQFAAIALAILLVGGILAFQTHFVPVMVGRGASVAAAGTLLSLMAGASVVTNIVLGTLNDRMGTPTAVVVGFGFLAASFVAYTLSGGVVPLALSTVVFAVGLALPGVLIPILVMEMFGMRDYAAILGATMAMLPAGTSLGMPLWGLAIDLTGSYTIALISAAVAAAVAGGLTLWAVPSAKRARERLEQA